MKSIVDIIIIVFLILGTYAGWRRGVIKSLINFLGLIAVAIISFYLKTYIANFLIDVMPFFNFAGLNCFYICIYYFILCIKYNNFYYWIY